MAADPADLWLEMSAESFEAGLTSEQANRYRSAISRYYYSAYQAATAALVAAGMTPPTGREAWSHDATPELFIAQLSRQEYNDEQSSRLADDLEALYTLRVRADYSALWQPTS